MLGAELRPIRSGLIGLVGVLAIAACASTQASASPLDFSGKYLAQTAADFPTRSGYSAITLHIEGDGSLRYARELRIRDLTNECLVAGARAPMGPLEYSQAALTAEFLQPVLAQFSNTTGYLDAGAPPAEVATPSTVDRALADARLGCGREAMAASMVDAAKYESARQVLSEQLAVFRNDFWQAAPIEDLNRSWSSCMRAAGFDTATPNGARDAAVRTPNEQRTAAADHQCRETTGYTATFDRLFNSAEAEFIVAHRPLIDELTAAAQLPA